MVSIEERISQSEAFLRSTPSLAKMCGPVTRPWRPVLPMAGTEQRESHRVREPRPRIGGQPFPGRFCQSPGLPAVMAMGHAGFILPSAIACNRSARGARGRRSGRAKSERQSRHSRHGGVIRRPVT